MMAHNLGIPCSWYGLL